MQVINSSFSHPRNTLNVYAVQPTTNTPRPRLYHQCLDYRATNHTRRYVSHDIYNTYQSSPARPMCSALFKTYWVDHTPATNNEVKTFRNQHLTNYTINKNAGSSQLPLCHRQQPSRPNNVGLKCLFVRTSVRLQKVFSISMMHDGMQYDLIQGRGQGHEPLKVRSSAIFKGYLLPHL